MRPETYRSLDIGSGVRVNARRFPGKEAVRQGDQVLSYGALGARMNRVTHASEAAGLGKGANAAILSANVPEYFEVVAGASATGAAVATVNPNQTVGELSAILEDCDARLVFCDATHAEKVQEAATVPVHVFGADYEDWLSRASDRHPDVLPEEWETFAIPYTSGTTGKPKGVSLPHRSRVVSFLVFASVYGCFGVDDHFLVTTPLFHGGGFAFPMATLFLGGTVELMPAYSPGTLARLIGEGRHSGTFVVPTQLHSIFDLSEAERAQLANHRFRSVICNAAPLPEETKLGALERLGEGVLHETYGSTEGGVITNLAPIDMLRKQNCAGQPIAGQDVRLLDDAGAPVAVGEIGELFSNGPTLFNGYWNRPEETKACFRGNWFSAGDLARMDDEGYVYIMDRKKDMILSGGVNVYPREIEEVLFALPGVNEAAVIGVPDTHWGEAVCAYVRSGNEQPLESNLLAACREKLAPHKVPKAIRFIDVIPRNVAGKVMKRELRDRWGQGI